MDGGKTERPGNGTDAPVRPRMSNRYPRPLNAEDWAQLMENLKRGPTPAQRKAVDDALELAKRVKLVD